MTIELLRFAREDLQKRVNEKPQPPSDWSRPVPDGRHDAKLWKILEAFLQSQVAQILDFRKNQQERNALESAIGSVTIDLRTETIKKGSPHTLRIIKTQAAYQRQMKAWLEDVAILEQVEGRRLS